MIACHNHSDYSALDGLSKPDEIAARILETGMRGAFITDHGVIAGWRNFAKTMSASGLFAGFGMEAYQAATSRSSRPEGRNKRDQGHLILLAKNNTGVRNIMRMNYEANKDGFYYVPRVDWELLEEYKEGVICTSACIAGLVARGIANDKLDDMYKLRRIFGDDFFLEIHTYDPDKLIYRIGDGDEPVTVRQMNNQLVSIAADYGIPMVYANDAHYACIGDYPSHEVLLATQQMRSIKDPDRMRHNEPCLYIMDEADVREALDYLPQNAVDEAIANSDRIAEQCEEATLPQPGKHLPVFIPKSETKENNPTLLVRLVQEGCMKRYGSLTPEIIRRAIYELETIVDAGLVDYFLITHDFCVAADEKAIGRGPGRGSVGGSIIAYALGITDIDPLKYNLYFERFYNAGRDEGLPDIDIDFSKKDRHKIDEYLKERWGKYNVIPIGNHVTMKPLACLQKLTKPFDMEYAVVDEIKKIVREVPDIEILSSDQIGWRMKPGIQVAILEEEIINEEGQVEIVPSPVAQQLAPYMEAYPSYFEAVEKLSGRISNYGIHASAIIISDVDIRDVLPVMLRTDDDSGTTGKKTLVTQVEMREVEAMGFPKFDRLGLKTIDILEEVRTSIGEGIDYYRTIDWDAQPEEMWELIDKGLTLGLFQVETGMAKKVGKRLKPRNIEDLALIVALNRPGPLRSGATERFLNCREQLAQPRSVHPILDTILAPTKGEFVYQEQIIAYFTALGYDAKESDGIRKMLGKKMVVKMQEEYPQYLERALEFMEEETASEIWNEVIEFSLYSFNKAHAIAYGFILARALFVKYNYSHQFIMAAIHEAADLEQVGGFVREALRMGVDIHAPDINKSMVEVEQVGDSIYFGIADVKNVGTNAAKWIIQNRPYTSFKDLQDKHALAQEQWDKDKVGRSPKQTLTSRAIQCLRDAGAFDEVSPRQLTVKKMATMQSELLGVTFYNPIADIIEDNADALADLHEYSDLESMIYYGEILKVPGFITNVKKTVTKRGKNPGAAMGIVKMTWEGEEIEFPVFPDKWENFTNWLLKEGNVGVFSLRNREGGAYFEGGTKLVATEAVSGELEQVAG